MKKSPTNAPAPEKDDPQTAPDLPLTESENVVLAVVAQLGREAYPRALRDGIADLEGRRYSLGRIYAVLGALEKKGMVNFEIEPPTEERGGRRKKRAILSGAGQLALDHARQRSATIYAEIAGAPA